MPAKNWLIEGKYVEYCSCDLGCPCESMADPTYGHCTGLVGFKIDNGYCEDVRLDGLAVVGTFYFPRAIHHGQGVFQPIIDERADEAQRGALRALVEGTAGGPWGIFRKTFRELHGPRFARFESDTRAQLPAARIGDVVTYETEPIRNPVTKETIHPRIVLPEGLVLKEAALAATSRFVVQDEHVRYDHSGKYASYGYFQYFGP